MKTLRSLAALCLLALGGITLTSQANAQNLIVNGDFSAGNMGFTSQYLYIAHGPNNPNEYGVISR